jgi:hypothetical protein
MRDRAEDGRQIPETPAVRQGTELRYGFSPLVEDKRLLAIRDTTDVLREIPDRLRYG